MTSTARRGTVLLDLPPELLESIMQDLPAKSRARVGVTSKQLRAVTTVPIGYQEMLNELTNWAEQFVIKTNINTKDRNTYRDIVQKFYKQTGEATMIVDLLKEGTNLYYKVNVIRTIPDEKLGSEETFTMVKNLLKTTKVTQLNTVVISAYKARVDHEINYLSSRVADTNALLTRISSLKK